MSHISRLGHRNPNFFKVPKPLIDKEQDEKNEEESKKELLNDQSEEKKTAIKEHTAEKEEKEEQPFVNKKDSQLFFIPLEKKYNLKPIQSDPVPEGKVCRRTPRGYSK